MPSRTWRVGESKQKSGKKKRQVFLTEGLPGGEVLNEEAGKDRGWGTEGDEIAADVGSRKKNRDFRGITSTPMGNNTIRKNLGPGGISL